MPHHCMPQIRSVEKGQRRLPVLHTGQHRRVFCTACAGRHRAVTKLGPDRAQGWTDPASCIPAGVFRLPLHITPSKVTLLMSNRAAEAAARRRRFAPVAQRTEQLPSKQEVVGSNPARGAERKTRIKGGLLTGVAPQEFRNAGLLGGSGSD